MASRKNLMLLTVLIMLYFMTGCIHEKNQSFKPATLITSDENISTITSSDDEILLSHVINLTKESILMTYDGGYYPIEIDGTLVPSNNGVTLKNKNGKKLYENIVGIINDPPKRSIMDVYHESKFFIERNEKVMVIYIDGWAWHQYEYLKENHPELYLSQSNSFEKALAVYKPVTNSGYAAMITGLPPYENGIINRNYREPKVETIFQLIEKKNKKIVLVEGNSNVINVGIDPILNLDTNENSSNDDEIFNSAMNNMHPCDYLFVHFHGFDDTGHSYGPYGSKTIDKFLEIDHYVEQLATQWKGKIIVTTDHGMHLTEKGGSHGEFRYEDLIVPFGILEGGQN
jgi:hypothetical protein